jgi:hypothetical protein
MDLELLSHPNARTALASGSGIAVSKPELSWQCGGRKTGKVYKRGLAEGLALFFFPRSNLSQLF